MEIINIDINKLFVSELNVRKTLTSEEDETSISDLAIDIERNGIINPLTVRLNGDKYEIIAGQRRYLAMKMLNRNNIPCNVLDIDTQKAEEISLVENVQRNQMTTVDKIRSYSRLYRVYDEDIDKVVSAVHVSRQTIQKYLKIEKLPDEIIERLDSKSQNKISIEVALELSKIPDKIDKVEFLKNTETLTNVQKMETIKQYVKHIEEEDDDDEEYGQEESKIDVNVLTNIKNNVVLNQTNIRFAPSYPYVHDNLSEKNIRIPEVMFEEIVDLIRAKMGFSYILENSS
jgi:ParB family chromosome partitioning protein